MLGSLFALSSELKYMCALVGISFCIDGILTVEIKVYIVVYFHELASVRSVCISFIIPRCCALFSFQYIASLYSLCFLSFLFTCCRKFYPKMDVRRSRLISICDLAVILLHKFRCRCGQLCKHFYLWFSLHYYSAFKVPDDVLTPRDALHGVEKGLSMGLVNISELQQSNEITNV